LWWLRPDGKTQVTIEYLQKADGSVEPQKIHTVVISTQHAEPLKATRSKECAGYSGPEMTAPSMEDMNKLIVEEVIKETLKEITLKNGKAALTLFGDHTHLHINPSGKDDLDVGAGDQGIMFGYASDETEDCMPLTHSMATRLGKKLTDVRKSGKLWWLRPDGKTQVTIEYLQDHH